MRSSRTSRRNCSDAALQPPFRPADDVALASSNCCVAFCQKGTRSFCSVGPAPTEGEGEGLLSATRGETHMRPAPARGEGPGLVSARRGEIHRRRCEAKKARYASVPPSRCFCALNCFRFWQKTLRQMASCLASFVAWKQRPQCEQGSRGPPSLDTSIGETPASTSKPSTDPDFSLGFPARSSVISCSSPSL